MKRTIVRGCLAVAAAGTAAVTWGSPVPSGVIAEYLVHCDPWAMTYSEASCAGLVDRLDAAEDPSRDERLALLLVRRKSLSREEGCAGLEAIVADHPDYAYAMYYLSLYGCVNDKKESVALLRRAAEIEPDNYHVLAWLLISIEGLPEAADFDVGRDFEIDPSQIAEYREALYEAGMARAAWWQAVVKEAAPDGLPSESVLQATIWEGPLTAGRSIYAAALREGDRRAAEAIQARLLRDLSLDVQLDYGTTASLALACQPILYGSLGLEDVCISGVEKLATRASANGLPLPGYVLEEVARATDIMRRNACAASMGQPSYGRLALRPGDCEGPEATEIAPVARLREVLEHHGGPWSSEHHRVHAQGFLGNAARREGLRAALRADPENARARCDLAGALAREDSAAAARFLGAGANPKCLVPAPVWGDSRDP